MQGYAESEEIFQGEEIGHRLSGTGSWLRWVTDQRYGRNV